MKIDLRPRVLYFVFQQGCGACAEAEPVFEEALKRRPMIMALKIDANGPHVARLPVKLKATPTWMYRIGDQATLREGVMGLDDLLAWIDQVEQELT